ncbi:MAG: PQQ-binding-like beta-propeller repeat protein [Phycisphaerales bacterium]|jgi:outer membrane protein assembly factor BamB
MKTSIFISFLSVLVIINLTATIVFGDKVSEAQPAWRTLGGNFQRTGLSEISGPELGCVKWKFETDGAVTSSITIGSENRIHIACEDGKLYTLNEDGSLLWSYDANSPLLSSPTIGPDGSVYVGSQNGKLYAIDINGNLQWMHDTDGFIYSSPAVSEDGRVYVGSQDGVLYALDSDGSKLWTFATNGIADLSGSILASPSIGIDGSIYIGGLYDPNLYAIDPNTGVLKWTCNFESKGWPFASPVVAEDGTIYQTLIHDPNLYTIDHNNGDIIWSVNLADPYSGFFDSNYSENYGNASGWSEPALGPDGTIYVSFDDPYLRAVDPDGHIKWMTRLGDIGGFTLTVGGNGLIYAASDDSFLYVVKPDGQEVSRFQSDNWLSYPVITADDTIIVADSRDNSLLIEYTKNTVFALSPECNEGQVPDLVWVGDLNSDGNVNFSDFAMLTEQWLNKE